MVTTRQAAFLALALAAAPLDARGQTNVQAAHELYAAADYAGALEVLAQLDGSTAPGAAIDVARYRLLCLVALGRTSDAQQAVQTLVHLAPFARLSEDEASPSVRARFDEWRLKTLPEVALLLFSSSKDAYSRKDYEAAASGFADVQRLIAEIDQQHGEGATGLADLRVLVSGFHDLSIAAAQAKALPPSGAAAVTMPVSAPASTPDPLASSTTASPATAAREDVTPLAPASPPASATPPAPANATPSGAAALAAVPASEADGAARAPADTVPSSASSRVYTSVDTAVTPPRALRQSLPSWPSQLPKSLVIAERAVVEVTISAEGVVESAQIRRGIHPYYDTLLLQAVRTWRYEPATLNGAAVRYARPLEIRVQ